MRDYTVGFIFNRDLSRVLLVHKLSPEWQKGKVNGVGGKIEEGESPLDCIVREVKEETTLETEVGGWVKLGKIINANKTQVSLFSYVFEGVENDAKANAGEEIEWFDVDQLPPNIMTNLSWLIPLALDVLKNGEIKSVLAENKD